MAYKITSQKGKDIAINMMPGETRKVSDGSTWTKKADGSVSVTHNGKTYDNAYTKSDSSSSNKSSGSSSGGGSSSNKNSQYTGYNYTIGSEKGKNIATNMAIGEPYVATDGSVWKKENDGTITVNHGGNIYNNAYTPSDYSTLIQQQIAAGVPYQYVQNSINSRLDKASNDPSLNQYMYDDVYNNAWNYILAGMEKENDVGDFSYSQEQPTAPNQDPRIDKLINQILNRDDFSYDVMNDPLYQQYKEMYNREGDRAMRDTLAEAAAGAGGMNTYAMTAAMQANNYYNSQLNDKIPELYQLAYQMYLNDKESMVQDLGILQDMDATQYSRYRDTMNDYYNDRNFAYGIYQDAVNQGNWQTNFDYNAMVNNRDWMNNNYWANKEWNTNQADKELDNSRYDQETAYNKLMTLIENGVTSGISPELIEQAGYTQEEVDNLIAAVQLQIQMNASGGSSGNRKSSSDRKSLSDSYLGDDEDDEGDKPKEGDLGWEDKAKDAGTAVADAILGDMSDYTFTNQHTDTWIEVSGLTGRFTYKEVLEMVDNGTVKEVVDIKNKTITYVKA